MKKQESPCINLDYQRNVKLNGRLVAIRLISVLTIILVSASIYINTLDGQFLSSWDDKTYVIDNLLIRDISSSGIFNILSSPLDGTYQPLTVLSLAIDYHLWGMEPFGFHLTSTILHVFNALLVYAFLRKLLIIHGKGWTKDIELVAAIGAMLFLSHPVNVESVAWITERKSLLSACFFLLAFNAYLNYKMTSRHIYYTLSLTAFLVAAISKSIVIVFPFLIIFYDYIFFCKKGDGFRRLFVDKVPFLLLSAAIAGLQILTHAAVGFIHAHPSDRPLYTFYTMLKVLIIYIKNSFFPLSLSGLYNIHVSKSVIEPSVLLSISLLLLLTVVLYLKKNDRILLFAAALFFTPLLPVLNIVKIAIFMADRYLYIPLIAFSLIMSITLYRISIAVSQRVKVVKISYYIYILSAVFIIYEYSFLSIKRGDVWQDDIALWEDIIYKNSKEGNVYNFYYILANTYSQKGQYKDALAFINRAMELSPNNATFIYERAFIFIKTGDYMRAGRDLERIRYLEPDFDKLYYGLGSLYTLQGKLDDADKAWKRFLELYKFDPYIDDPLVKSATLQIEKYKTE